MTTDLLANPQLEPQIDAAAIQQRDRDYVMGTYARQPVVFVRGSGATLWDSEGREYLDFLGGIAVVQVGHCHPTVARAIAVQAKTLMHVSNLFHNEHQATLAERLCGLTGMEKVFFCNSGTEANECAIKIARKWGKAKRGDSCYEIVTFQGSFHGRTYGSVSATAQPKYQDPFQPVVPGFVYAPLNDLDALRALVSEKTCAIIIEPIQGESGIHLANPAFLQAVRALCDEKEILLILDEVQCGMARTGTFLASQGMGVTGDVITLAKGIADGFPMGACLARGSAATTLVPGDHGSTFAGQPLACAAALATLDVIEHEHLMQHAAETGEFLMSELRLVGVDFPGQIKEVRGAGLMIGVEFTGVSVRQIAKSLLANGIVVNAVGDTIMRLVPPLIVTREECLRMVDALRTALTETA
jgi:predicted acetylornithine/succinylornithine family transaminase